MSAPPLAVVALGGNALIRPGERGEISRQREHVRESVRHLPLLLDRGYRLLITHGNGPAVGHLLLQNEAAKGEVPPLPLDVCDADSEGGIGYLIQQALCNVLAAQGKVRPVASLVTQIVVEKEDPAFLRPDKPVGPFYDAAAANELVRLKGWTVRQDAGRGYRRVVASPSPREIVEAEAISILLDKGAVVIAGGGGGIPVVHDPSGRLEGVEAVIDKDRTAALLARRFEARLLVILTAEEKVFKGYGTPRQVPLETLTVAEAKRLADQGEFPPGSMGPKIEAAVEFLESGGEEVIITLPETLQHALEGRTGTRIIT